MLDNGPSACGTARNDRPMDQATHPRSEGALPRKDKPPGSSCLAPLMLRQTVSDLVIAALFIHPVMPTQAHSRGRLQGPHRHHHHGPLVRPPKQGRPTGPAKPARGLVTCPIPRQARLLRHPHRRLGRGHGGKVMPRLPPTLPAVAGNRVMHLRLHHKGNLSTQAGTTLHHTLPGTEAAPSATP